MTEVLAILWGKNTQLRYHSGSVLFRLKILLGPLVFFITWKVLGQAIDPKAACVAGLALWMLSWWVLEIVPLFVTALLPILILPLGGISSLTKVTPYYASDIIFLFLGGFLLARAIEKWCLHELVARLVLRFAGNKPSSVLLSLMATTAFLSMWISNTAAVLVMLPLGVGLLHQAGLHNSSYSKAIKFGIAYAATFGGLGTIIGSPPNGILVGYLRNEMQIEITFLKWMAAGLPLAIVGTWILWHFLRVYFRSMDDIKLIEAPNIELKMSPPQKRVLWTLISMALLWILTPFIKISGFQDASVSVLGAIALFIIPAGDSKSTRILETSDFHLIAWPILILFGGGLALSHGVQASGLGEIMSQKLFVLSELPNWLSLFFVSLSLIFLTEIASNTAVASIFVPLLAPLAALMNLNLIILLFAVTLASSLSFMLPSATPPNAAAFAYGHLSIRDMMKVGLYLNLIAAVLVTAYAWFYLPLIF